MQVPASYEAQKRLDTLSAGGFLLRRIQCLGRSPAQVMGVNALDRSYPVEKQMRESVVFPLYDAGNIGMQTRKIFITEDSVDTILAAAAGAE